MSLRSTYASHLVISFRCSDMHHSFFGLASFAERLARTKSRRELARLVGEFLKNLDSSLIPIAANFIVGRVFPEWDGRSLGLSWAAVFKVVSELVSKDNRLVGGAADASAFYAGASNGGKLDKGALDAGASDKGILDAGEAVERIMGSLPVKKPALELGEVYRYFEEIAGYKKIGARKKKEGLLKELLSRATPVEAKFISKIVIGEMRHGVNEGVVADAVARASGIELKAIQRAQMLGGDLGRVAQSALTNGEVTSIQVVLFRPLKPMLAQTAKNIGDAFRELNQHLALEYKYDGARLQIHKVGNEVKIFSRRLTDLTGAFPEIATQVQGITAVQAILEGEVIGVDRNDRPLPFQHIMRRLTRVKEVEKMIEAVPARFFLFDCLFLNGDLLIDLCYEERWQRLEKIKGSLLLAERIIPETEDAGERFLERALSTGHEGVMAKALSSPYTPGVRGKFWLKIKPAVTLDLVIVAADWGYGRRHAWLSNYHLAAWDEERKEFAVVGKTFKGLTDAEFSRMTKALLNLKINEKRGTISVEPRQVVEVAFNEIQASSHYRSGMALRFARITRIRDDKSPGDCATIQELKSIYEHQFVAKGKMTGK